MITPPRDYTQELMDMAEEYSKSGNELAQIQVSKSSAILFLKAKCKTMREAELQWQCTPEGKKELELVYKLRGLKELMQALKTKIRISTDEHYGHY